MRTLGIVALCAAPTLSACGGNQALLASGGHQDFVAMRQVTEEYGVAAEPHAVVPVTVCHLCLGPLIYPPNVGSSNPEPTPHERLWNAVTSHERLSHGWESG